MKSSVRCFKIKREDIAYFKFILEGYQGLAMMKTLDASQGLVLVCIPPGAEHEVSLIIRELSEDLSFSEVAIPVNDSDIVMEFSPNG